MRVEKLLSLSNPLQTCACKRRLGRLREVFLLQYGVHEHAYTLVKRHALEENIEHVLFGHVYESSNKACSAMQVSIS